MREEGIGVFLQMISATKKLNLHVSKVVPVFDKAKPQVLVIVLEKGKKMMLETESAEEIYEKLSIYLKKEKEIDLAVSEQERISKINTEMGEFLFVNVNK